MSENDLIEKLDCLISTLSKPSVPIDWALWDAEACAAYLIYSARHFAERIACRPDFPAAIRLGDGPKANLRWKATEVMEWAEGRREKRAA